MHLYFSDRQLQVIKDLVTENDNVRRSLGGEKLLSATYARDDSNANYLESSVYGESTISHRDLLNLPDQYNHKQENGKLKEVFFSNFFERIPQRRDTHNNNKMDAEMPFKISPPPRRGRSKIVSHDIILERPTHTTHYATVACPDDSSETVYQSLDSTRKRKFANTPIPATPTYKLSQPVYAEIETPAEIIYEEIADLPARNLRNGVRHHESVSSLTQSATSPSLKSTTATRKSCRHMFIDASSLLSHKCKQCSKAIGFRAKYIRCSDCEAVYHVECHGRCPHTPTYPHTPAYPRTPTYPGIPSYPGHPGIPSYPGYSIIPRAFQYTHAGNSIALSNYLKIFLSPLSHPSPPLPYPSLSSLPHHYHLSLTKIRPS